MLKLFKRMMGSTAAITSADLDGESFKTQFENTPNAVLIDVRTPPEFALGTINGATDLDIFADDFEHHIRQLSKTNVYFVFCRSGRRSRNALELMEMAGLTAYDLASGINAWPNKPKY
jgi:rhodanese-related sulfurtransferase